MFEDDDSPKGETPDRPQDPAQRATEKADELRTHAQLAAVFEGTRKFDAQLRPTLSADLARDVQRTIAKLEKSKSPDSPILLPDSLPQAKRLLLLPITAADLPTNDYHLHRRPGELMIARWLAGDEVDSFYERLQAHFDAAMEGLREDERQAHEWRNDPQTHAYLKALSAININMAERYLRDPIRKLNLTVLSTQTADELNIAYLCDYIMQVSPADLVGEHSAPPSEAPIDKDLAWFFKLFSLRAQLEGVERMLFFAFLQKTDDSPW